MPTVLALETSCDESAAAVVRQGPRTIEVIAHAMASQVEEHAQWGGVVPEIASRRHVEALPHLVDEVLSQAGLGVDALDVELVLGLGQLQRLAHDHACYLTAEVLIQRAIVDGDAATAVLQEHPCR